MFRLENHAPRCAATVVRGGNAILLFRAISEGGVGLREWSFAEAGGLGVEEKGLLVMRINNQVVNLCVGT